jgi:GNAT superfamily N-acetyltransferase
MKLKISTMSHEHLPAAMKLKELAGWNQTEKDWQLLIKLNPEGCYVALHGRDVVGTVTTMTYEGRISWVGMMLVDPAVRRRGIGTALLTHALTSLQSRGVGTIKLDATPGGKPFYDKLGFVSEYELERWTLHRHFSPIRSFHTPTALSDAISLDRDLFGADRTSLLASVFESAPHLAIVRHQDSRPVGYTFGREGALADHMGPWVAMNQAIASTLLDEFLIRSTRMRVCIDCIKDSEWAIPVSRSRGFICSRPLTRMTLGRPACPQTVPSLGAILGPEFG